MTETSPLLQTHNKMMTSFNTWKENQSNSNLNTLLKDIDPILNNAVNTFGGSNSPNIKSRAKILAIDALQKYDPNKSQLNTYLFNQLQPLRRYSLKSNPINMPEKSYLESQHVKDATIELEDTLGRQPSDGELADFLGMNIRKVRRLKTYNIGTVSSSIFTDEEGNPNLPAYEQFSDNERNIMEFVYHDLDPVKQKILDYKLGIHGKEVMKNRDIANLLKLSPGRVSQMSNDIADLLDRTINDF